MSEHHVWVHYGDPYDSRWHACTVLRHLPDGQVEVELEPAAPPVSSHIGLDGLGTWPGPGVQVDPRGCVWVPFPPPDGYRPPEPQPKVGTRTITVPAELVHADRGDISTGWHPSYEWRRQVRTQPGRRSLRHRVSRRLRELVRGEA